MNKYFEALKLATKKTKPAEIELDGKTIKVKTIEQLLELKCPTQGNGIYSAKALDILALDPSADVSAYLLREPEHWGAPKETKPYYSTPIVKEMLDAMWEATKFVSKDTYHANLMKVHFFDGDMFATDGYRAYVRRFAEKPHASLSVLAISALKKTYNPNYVIHFCEARGYDDLVCLTDGVMSIYEVGEIARPPKMRQLLEEKLGEFDKTITLPVKSIKKVMEKYDHNTLLFDNEDGTMNVVLDSCKGRTQVPIKATIKSEPFTFTKGCAEIRVVLPRVPVGDEYLNVDTLLFSQLPTDKDGSISFRIKESGEKDLKSIMLLV